MSKEGPIHFKEHDLKSARILMISRFNSESIGGIPSTVQHLETAWKEVVQNVSTIRPDNEKQVNLYDDWDLVIFHHPSAFGVKKFLELPKTLKSKSSIIWYQAVDPDTLKTFRELGVGKHFLVPSILSVNAEMITRKLLTAYPGVLTYAISENVCNSLVKAGIITEGKVEVIQIPPALNYETVVSKDFDERGRENFVVLSVSRISPEKGIERIFEIYSNIFNFVQTIPGRTLKPVKFIVAGDAANKSYDRKITKKTATLPTDNRCKIEFVGKKREEELMNLYQNAHIFLMPSKFDSWGLVTLEAMHYGIPIIAFDSPGTKEIFARSENQIGKIVNSTEDGTRLLADMMMDRPLWTRFSKGASNEAEKYKPHEISLSLLRKLWSDRFKTKL